MTLRSRTLLSIALTMGALIVVLYALSHRIVLGSFVELETRLARRNMAQVLSVVQGAADTLDVMVFDWAAWDDTYEFIQDLNPAYVESNLVNETFISSRINFVVFVDDRGNVVYTKGYDFRTATPLPIPDSLILHVTGKMPLAHHTEIDDAKSGLLVLPEGPLLVAARPILTSQEEGPIRGSLLMARYLDDAEIEQLSEFIITQFSVWRFDEVPLDVRVALQTQSPVLVRPLDLERLVGYGLLYNIYDEPALVLEETTPREIYRQGLRSISYLIVALVIVGVVSGGVVLGLLERTVLVRLALLTERVDTIGTQEDFSARVALPGKDELARLGQTINGMLDALELAQRQRAEVEQALRQYARELEARNEELDAFAHTVAHDLKNPLAKIVGYCALLENYGQTLSREELEQSLDVIEHTGWRMSRIIDELLLLASMHQMEEVALSALDMASVVAVALEQVELLVQDSGGVILLPAQWPVAWGYAPWVEEVWANYLSNALKYGGVPPHIEMGASEQEDGAIRFWIRDNGAGLSPEEQSRLFTPFTRLDQIRARGHGLGLSIVRRIVEKLGGEVGVDSERKAGSTFWFTLPAGPSE